MSVKDRTIIKAVAATAASTLLICGIFFYFFYRFAMARQRQRNKYPSIFCRAEAMVTRNEFRQQESTLKGVIVDEIGVDVLYLRKKHEGGQLSGSFSKVGFNSEQEEEKRVDSRLDKHKTYEPIHEIPLLHEPSHKVDIEAKAVPTLTRLLSPASGQMQPRLPPPDPQPAFLLHPLVIPMQKTPPPPPPPPPPPIPSKQIPKPPLPPLTSAKRNPAPPTQVGGLVSSLKPPTAPRGRESRNSNNSRTEASTGESTKGNGEIQLKMQPLHWDKVIANANHSLVWDDINHGSFRFDDELLETLFGYTATNRNSERSNVLSTSGSSNSVQPTQIFILDPRKSQNTAIVLKSLAISRKEILDALLEGRGLDADTLEKLTKISPTQEEAAKILQFNGNPTKLADAESFLYQILKAVPSASVHTSAMLFRSNYDPEILHLKESLQTLELGCKELRTRGIFLKLLEAILKTGNRMNAGTARGNAQGFNLSSLQKLSNVKSTDGKTTLLHFVVEQVVRSEGKRCVIHRNHDLSRGNSQSSKNSDHHSNSLTAKEVREKEYLLLGLPVLGGLSTEFSNVKKAASIDYDSFINKCSSLTGRVTEIRQLVAQCSSSGRGGFVREMKGFLEECEEELKVVREEQTRVMELVKRTTEYYQAGVFKDKGTHLLQIFVVVKDFLGMVDQVCIDITRTLQKRNMNNVATSLPLSPPTRTLVRFQNLQAYFTPEKPGMSSSSESEDDF
ncbi:unnamed protein product [Ilex paraguariensis]|uniref:Formin-like protein n=1 Tax=Ilex paraguariensis TaxID=185542 RepID=A0ABC8U6C8_9AQUA